MHTIAYYQTVAGTLRIAETARGIISAEFINQVPSDALSTIFDNNILDMKGTLFQLTVWKELLKTPAGSVVTYQELAVAIGRPKSWRAVARAVATNSIAYFIPCHRVIRKNGELGGYKWGIERKRMLLEQEGFRALSLL